MKSLILLNNQGNKEPPEIPSLTEQILGESKMVIEMDVETAKAVREILFEAQYGYSYNEAITPPRVTKIRSVIDDIDSKME